MIAFFLTVLIMMATIGGLFTFFEICILRLFFKIENFKYVKLLKKLEIAVFLFAFIMLTSLKISTILLSLIDFIINFIFLFVDFYVMNLVIIKLPKNYLIFKNLYGII